VGTGRKSGGGMSRVADLIVGGWKIDPIISAHSGFPVTINAQDVSNPAVRGGTRANHYKSVSFQDQTIDHWFGTATHTA